ncbi:endonuclease/exonuclease/phosphatase family protein [Nocardia thailandica]|uniref:Endonuclease/exonuclease/phosphatase family protein n=1 Tax=Nocardia thailandica TaxID=257275 RepID=A0ABW6PIE3_9NOCA|nr:endonuclease/exonuclease/phosphatase family protein [Nocardia thailandica]
MVREWMGRAALVLGWGALLGGIIGIVLHLGRWQQRDLVLLSSGATYLMGGAVVAAVLFLLARSWWNAGIAGAAVATVLAVLVPAWIPTTEDGDGPEIMVLQSNILFGGADPAAVTAIVRDHRVDVATIDELTDAAVVRLRAAGLEAELPYRYLEPARDGGGGTGIYSRYPLRDTVKYDGFIMSNVSAIMEHPQRGPVSVYAFHPIPPNLNFPAWKSEMARVDEILGAATAPALVGADFNATRDHAAYRGLLDGPFAAAAEQTGDGMLPTFPADRRWGPVLGIDHVLVAGGVAQEVRTLTVPGSDHRAMLARVRMDR